MNLYPPTYDTLAFIMDAVRRSVGIPAHALAGALDVCDKPTRQRIISARLAAGMT